MRRFTIKVENAQEITSFYINTYGQEEQGVGRVGEPANLHNVKLFIKVFTAFII